MRPPELTSTRRNKIYYDCETVGLCIAVVLAPAEEEKERVVL